MPVSFSDLLQEVQLIAPLTPPAAADLYVQPAEDPLVPSSEADPDPNVNLSFFFLSSHSKLLHLHHIYMLLASVRPRLLSLHISFCQVIISLFLLMPPGRLAVTSCPFYTKVSRSAHWSTTVTLLSFQHGNTVERVPPFPTLNTSASTRHSLSQLSRGFLRR